MKVNPTRFGQFSSLKLYFLTVLFFLCKVINGQAPNQPTNPSPANNGQAPSTSPALCARVSDPNGGSLRVRYYGRPQPVTGSNKKFTVILLPDTQFYTEQPQGAGNNAMFKAQDCVDSK
jgi:hypothetical protein